ncbi:MAG: lysophospholipid acyltransferase family protein [Chakrabartia sp.]
MASLSIAKSERVHPRAYVRVTMIALALLILLPAHLLVRRFTYFSPFSRLFLRFSAWIVGVDIQITGPRVLRDVLYIANHVSWLDVLVLSGRTGCAFVAKSDMAPWPIIGWLASLNNSVYVQREKRLDAGAQKIAIQAALETHQAITLFPEGTTANGNELLPFRSSLIASVTPPPEGITIQPVAIDYGTIAAAIAWVDDEPVGKNALRVMSRAERFPVILHFLTPLDHADFDDRKAIAAHSRDAIAARLFPAYSQAT